MDIKPKMAKTIFPDEVAMHLGGNASKIQHSQIRH